MIKAGLLSEEQIAERFKELIPVELEFGTERLVIMFNELSETRSHSEVGPDTISYIEIKAYTDLIDDPLEPWEVEAIRLMDRAYCEEAYKLIKARMKKK